MNDSERILANGQLGNHPDLSLFLENTDSRDTVIIHQAGLIDTYNADFFRREVVRVVESGYRNIILNSSATTFMSSTGVGVYTALLKTIREHEGSLAIYGMPSNILDIFEILGFSKFFCICETREEALEHAARYSKIEQIPSVFPFVFTCPECSRRLRAVKPGRFRCSACRKVLVVQLEGKVLVS